MHDGIEADLVAVGVVQLGQDPANAGPVLATTLEAVARRAQVGARTVYLRFGTKAALFKRVVNVAIVGDTEPVNVLGRDWVQAALTAPTAAERIAASAAPAGRSCSAPGPCSPSPSRRRRSSR